MEDQIYRLTWVQIFLEPNFFILAIKGVCHVVIQVEVKIEVIPSGGLKHLSAGVFDDLETKAYVGRGLEKTAKFIELFLGVLTQRVE